MYITSCTTLTTMAVRRHKLITLQYVSKQGTVMTITSQGELIQPKHGVMFKSKSVCFRLPKEMTIYNKTNINGDHEILRQG